MDNTVFTLNLRGTKFEIFKSTFDKLDITEIRHVKLSDHTYFIDKSPQYFHLILDCVVSEKPLNPDTKGFFWIPFKPEGQEGEYFYKEAEMFGLCLCYYNQERINQSHGCKLHKLKLAEHLHHCNQNNHSNCRWWMR